MASRFVVSRVVVIGGGIGGLAAAARLAAQGHQVTLFERASTVGGKVGRHERSTPEGRFRFDTGPGLLTLPQVFADLFAATGSTLERELDLQRLDPVVRHVFADGAVLDSGSDPDAFQQRIADALGRSAAADWSTLWHRASRIFQASWHHVLSRPRPSPLDLAGLVWRLRDVVAIAPGRSLRGLGRAHLRDPRLRMLLERYATYTGSDPRRAPAALAAIPYAELTFGGWYPRGGFSTLADALLGRCEALGVAVHTSSEVRRIDVHGGRISGVTLSTGDRHAADLVVANADPVTVGRDLLGSRVHARAQRHARAQSLAGFVLMLGVRGRTPGLAHHTVLFPADYDAEFDAIFGRPARPADDPTLLVTVPDDPLVRPDGCEGWFVLANAPPHGHTDSTVDWRRPGLAETYADRLLDVLARRGFDVRERLLFREIRTPADLERDTASPGGAIYGTVSHGLRGLLRPPNRGPVDGLYLVGGSTHPGGGLPMVALSARIVADMIGRA